MTTAHELADKWEGAEEWMPLAWELCANECGEDACTELVWEGGPIPEPWGDRWLKYEDQAKGMIAMVRKHAPQDADMLRRQAAQIVALREALECGLEMTQELLAMKREALGDDYIKTRSYWMAERQISAALDNTKEPT